MTTVQQPPARTLVLLAGVLLAMLLTLGPPGPAQAAGPRQPGPALGLQPDIVLVMIDDLPQIDDRIWERLPTIKRLFLDHGVRFTRSIGNDPLCCPGRANVLTGQWSHHHGVVTNDGRLFDPTETIATELQGVGYWTGIFGKYFNQALTIPDPTPPGWDRTFLTPGGYYRYRALVDGREQLFHSDPEDYSTTQVRRRAVKALQAIEDPAAPRFLWLAPFAVHGGVDENGVVQSTSVPAVVDRGAPGCAGVAPWVTAATTEANLGDKPSYIQDKRHQAAGSLVPRCESLRSVDRMLAAVLAELKAESRPDPLVILTADNGMGWGAHGWGGKWVPYATPVPLFVSWPPVLGTARRTVGTTVTNVDLAPTLCAIAGCEMGPYPNGFGVDGIDVLPVLLGIRTTLGREVIFEEHHTTGINGKVVPWNGLRTTEEASIGQWVYTEYEDGERELYRIGLAPCWTWKPGDLADPCELSNHAGERSYAQVERRLAATLAARESHPRKVLPDPR